MSEYEKGIIPFVMGGLGNQMFINAAGYVVHKYTKSPLYILQNTLENNKHNKNNHDYNKNIFKYLGVHLPYKYNDDNFKNSLNYTTFSFVPAFSKWEPELIKPGTILSYSYFQYYPCLEPFENDLRELFLKGLEDYLIKLDNKDYSKCGFLHIRRGDYLNHPDIHINQSLDYYKDAVKILQEKGVQKIIVVSDDNDWVRSQEYFHLPIFEIYNSVDELDTLALIIKCSAGAICANSTFSWWGAFLGAFSLRNPVVVPKNWIARADTSNLFPSEWIVI